MSAVLDSTNRPSQIVNGTATQQIRIAKPQQSVIIPSHREAALKRLNDIETELGRMARLLTELRADILSLTIE